MGQGDCSIMEDEIYKDEILELVRARVLENSDGKVRRIILYGSRVMGTASEDSDYDILAVETDAVDKLAEIRRLGALFQDLDTPLDIWVMEKTEFEETKDVIGGSLSRRISMALR